MVAVRLLLYVFVIANNGFEVLIIFKCNSPFLVQYPFLDIIDSRKTKYMHMGSCLTPGFITDSEDLMNRSSSVFFFYVHETRATPNIN